MWTREYTSAPVRVVCGTETGGVVFSCYYTGTCRIDVDHLLSGAAWVKLVLNPVYRA